MEGGSAGGSQAQKHRCTRKHRTAASRASGGAVRSKEVTRTTDRAARIDQRRFAEWYSFRKAMQAGFGQSALERRKRAHSAP